MAISHYTRTDDLMLSEGDELRKAFGQKAMEKYDGVNRHIDIFEIEGDVILKKFDCSGMKHAC